MMPTTIPRSSKPSNAAPTARSWSIFDVLRRIWHADAPYGTDERAVLTAITLYLNNETGVAHPKIKTLAAHIGRTPRQVSRALSAHRERHGRNRLFDMTTPGATGGRFHHSYRFTLRTGADRPALAIVTPPTQQPAAHPTVTAERIVELWNAAAAGDGDSEGLRRCTELTTTRRRKLIALVRTHPDLPHWEAVIDRLAASGFCTGRIAGRSKQTWRADIDFLTKPDTHARTLEGAYDDRRDDGTGGRRNGRARNYDEGIASRGIKMISGGHDDGELNVTNGRDD